MHCSHQIESSGTDGADDTSHKELSSVALRKPPHFVHLGEKTRKSGAEKDLQDENL
jgi:hypothetical protein